MENIKESQLGVRYSAVSVLFFSLPLILSVLSNVLMYLLDRVMLARYCLHEMNAAAFSYQICCIFTLPFLSIAAMAEVLVGQFNGAKDYKKAAFPILQISLFLCLCWGILYPFSILVGIKLLPSVLYERGYSYLKISMLNIPFQFFGVSLAAFFIGTKRPKVVFYSVSFANVFSFVLKYLLIFGVGSLIPPMGATGAAIASVTAAAINVIILLCIFLSKYNSQKYETRKFSFHKKILLKNIYLGFPYAISEFVELLLSIGSQHLLIKKSLDYITVQNVCIVMWVFFSFLTVGLGKGITALASNCIGAGQENLLKCIIFSTIKLTMFFSLIFAFPLIFFSKYTITHVFNINSAELFYTLKTSLSLLCVVLVLIVLAFSCFAGILNAGGDTVFVTITKISAAIFCFAVPVIILFKIGKLEPIILWKLCIVQQIYNLIFLVFRYKSGKWKHNLIN